MNPETLNDLSIKISQYFLDFLESDFKRQQAPRRRVELKTDNGFKSGMAIAPYQELQKDLWSLLNQPVSSDLNLIFKPKIFYKQLSTPLRLVLNEQVKTISDSSILRIKTELINQAQSSLGEALRDPEDWIYDLHAVLMSEISSELVRPVLSLIDEALSSQAYSQIDSIFNAESDLIQIIAKPLEDVLTEVLARYSGTRDISELVSVTDERLNLADIQKALIDYFEMFASSDAFLEFRDIETYTSTAEGKQLYLYIGSIKYGASTYPMFYVPIECVYEESLKGFKVTISNKIFANKRAFDFILQEMNERQAKEWLSPIKERISYVGSDKSIVQAIEPMVTKIQEAFGLLDDFPFKKGPVKQLANNDVSLNNALFICAFESSDEAILNDYEEMIIQARNNQEGVVRLFQGIVGGVLMDNPTSIEQAIDQQWDDLAIEHRVVPESPLPLNEEQVKIINAISHPDGKFIVVEGPPGTGKSHTIVAIAADCAFKNKSCLILSDKKEALEVVQKKLSKTMNEVRGDSEFPNPLLRLGSDQANFRKLTTQETFTKVQAHSKANKNAEERLRQERNNKRDELKQSIKQTIQSFGNLKTRDIQTAEKLSNELNLIVGRNISEVLDSIVPDSVTLKLDQYSDNDEVFKNQLLEIYDSEKGTDFNSLKSEFKARSFVANIHNDIDKNIGFFCTGLKRENISQLSNLLSEHQALRMPILGYLLRGKQVAALNSRIQDLATFTKEVNLKSDATQIKNLLTQARVLISKIEAQNDPQIEFDLVYSYLTKKDPQSLAFKDVLNLAKVLSNIDDANLISELYVQPENADIFADTWIQSLKYVQAFQKIRNTFKEAPSFDYVGKKSEVEKLNVSLMNTVVDDRLINFMQNFKADVKVLAKLVKDKQKFPESKFDSVKEAFPLIVASIREFGEFMPLKNDIFDVLVIDEASQVSVAQAFPALLRAKKVVVMGDTKQFSNTKSSNASISLNDKYRSDLQSYFKREVSSDADMLQRLSFFDVKRSILEFSGMCSNYSIMLRKHFRSYQELISFSSKNFYGGQLQAIKIRGVPINEIIEFTELEGEIVSTRSTNQSEANFILEKCIELLKEDNPPTVGIITPYTDQQTLLSKLFSGHPLYQDFKSKLQIKIMTFDSCQGEERNIIFYSLVATKTSDTLNYIFPVTLENAVVEEKLKVQRLNVGFSRAQEMIWFVFSKPMSEFNGTIGQVLNHYNLILHTVRANHKDTDPLSPMESKVLDWLYSTEFYQLYEEDLEILPQFPIGDYLRQLDPKYMHPAYKVDFLLTYSHAKGILHIVVEYDGFEYHFKQDADIDAGNHERYLTDSDIERQLTLESYGYKFIRINRFNLGKDPVKTLSDRLYRLVDQSLQKKANDLVSNLQNQANSLINKTAKQCSSCEQIKDHQAFFDQKLKKGSGGFGRICIECKSKNENDSLQKHTKFRRRKWA